MPPDLTNFLDRHRPHDKLTGDATEPTEQGYMLTVQCSCGVVWSTLLATPEG